MKVVMLELPDSSAAMINNLSKDDRKKLASCVQFWATAIAKKQERSALEIMRVLQKHVSSQNLSEKEIEDLLNESVH